MPSPVHDSFAKNVGLEITKQIDQIANKGGDDPYINLAKQIETATTNDIRLGDSKCSPDWQFRHERARWPGVVIEVGYSQQRKAIEKLAHAYVAESDGGIHVILGLNIEYQRPGQEATMSIWRSASEQIEGTTDLELYTDQVASDEVSQCFTGHLHKWAS